MTSTPQDLLNPATFPVDPTTCQPISPSAYLKVNTIFNVAHDAGMLTAWSDKHPVYTSFNGPAGNGITDSFDPEIDSIALKPDGTPYPGNISWTGDNAATMQYDSYKVQAVLNWIDGYNHQRTQQVGVPAIFGMNFQTVSTAEKLPTSDGLAGGDLPGTNTPGPLLQRALQYVNDQLRTMDQEIQSQGLADSTAIVLSAKHGQSPQDPNQLTRIDDGPIIDGVNAAWAATHPGARPADRGRNRRRRGHVVAVRSVAGGGAVRQALPVDPHGDRQHRIGRLADAAALRAGEDLRRQGGGPLLRGAALRPAPSRTCGASSRSASSTPAARARSPSTAAPTRPTATCRSSSTRRAPSDRGVFNRRVETTQIAPTILQLLGLNPDKLQAVQAEGTRVLPGIGQLTRGGRRPLAAAPPAAARATRHAPRVERAPPRRSHPQPLGGDLGARAPSSRALPTPPSTPPRGSGTSPRCVAVRAAPDGSSG